MWSYICMIGLGGPVWAKNAMAAFFYPIPALGMDVFIMQLCNRVASVCVLFAPWYVSDLGKIHYGEVG